MSPPEASTGRKLNQCSILQPIKWMKEVGLMVIAIVSQEGLFMILYSRGGGPTGMNEKDYIDEKIKKYDEEIYKYKRSDFRNLRDTGFAFK